jgi:mannose-6-phosphate isomerase-like protein (cupin superfamily)
MSDVVHGDGYAVASLDALGEGPGFRKIRRELGVQAFGINAIVLPAGISTGTHWHERQEETYFVHQGTIEMEFGDGTRHRLDAGGIARVDPSTPRRIHNVGDGDAIYVIAGGADGYVGRDGVAPEGSARVGGPPGTPS